MNSLRTLSALPSLGLWVVANLVAAFPEPSAATSSCEGTRQELLSEAHDQRSDLDAVIANSGIGVEPAKAQEDTAWIRDWSFDLGMSCNDTGWIKYDNRVLNDGSSYWSINNDYSGTGAIADNAAVLAKHDLCWVGDGYGNNWDYSIVCEYVGASFLSFDYLSDSEPGCDFVTVEADSAGASESLADCNIQLWPWDPGASPEDFRLELLSTSGNNTSAVNALALPDFGQPGTTHKVYIRFESNAHCSDEDGLYPSNWSAGLVVDNLTISGTLAYSENFEGPLNSHVVLVNSAPSTPCGNWARLYPHITDNDKCTENVTCGWLFTDPSSVANTVPMAFGPEGNVIHDWLDNCIVSPWVSLSNFPFPGTVLSYRLFPGNTFTQSRIVLNWSVRTLLRVDNTDTSILGDSIDCFTPWRHENEWSTLDEFTWNTEVADVSLYFEPPTEVSVQFRFRVSDWQSIGGATPASYFNPGPGPYIDRIRVGRRVLTGPVLSPGIDSRTQAQDAFPTVQNSIAPGEHFSPASDIWGTSAFSMGGDLGINATSPNLITGDSIVMTARDVRGTGGLEVRWYGAIVSGPHAGKSLIPPYVVSANGFFEVVPEAVVSSSCEPVHDKWFVDLDDTYFRGGDELVYFWTGTDQYGAVSSSPPGIDHNNFPPPTIEAAAVYTGGLYEVSFLPSINWSPAYLARIAADSNGDLDPTPGEIAESSQRTCILYYNAAKPNRRSIADQTGVGGINRTSFMYTLDRLGYRGHYDVYDHQGYGNTNNQLGGRANVPQIGGYALIVHDAGQGPAPNLPDGTDLDTEKVDQCYWYRDYLAQGITSPVGVASLWIIGEDIFSERVTNALFSVDFGLIAGGDPPHPGENPFVEGVVNYTFTTGATAQFTGTKFSLNGGCPSPRDYDSALSVGSAVGTHRYYTESPKVYGDYAVIMNHNSALHYNTIWMGFNWSDIRETFDGESWPPNPSPDPTNPLAGPDIRLARNILNAALPGGCIQGESPTDSPGPEVEAVPIASALHQNAPNPFNPTTTIKFDLARDGLVRLQIFDVAGHLVKTLVDGAMARGYDRQVTWNGLDEAGQRVPSGVYFSRLVAPDFRGSRKLVVFK